MTQRIHIFLKPSGFKFRINWKEIHIYERKERHNREAMNIKNKFEEASAAREMYL